jgi:Glycosyltransferase family 92
VYLAVCAIYRDEAHDLPEWIEFHRLLGVERFFLYDNFSEDDHRRVLRPYVREGLVHAQEWPLFGDQQRRAYDHCLGELRDEARWIAFIDCDEFLFSPTGRPLPELLATYEDAPAVCVARREFMMSGHATRPDGLVIENYVRARTLVPDRAVSFKSIVDPSRTERCLNAHHFSYRDRALAVDEEGAAMKPPWRDRTVPCERLRVNHYFLKSAEEAQRKLATLDARGLPRPLKLPGDFDKWVEAEPEITYEDQALVAYAPAVRAALERSRGAC